MKFYPVRVITILLCLHVFSFAYAKSADQLYEDALQAFNKKEYAQSVILLKNIMRENPRHLSGRILLGKTFLLLSELENAEEQFRQALIDGADSSQILIPLGQSLLLQGKYQDVLDNVQLSEQTRLIATEVFSLRGRAYLELNQFELAKSEFDAAIANEPNEAVGYLGLAILELKLGNISLAQQWLDQVLEIDSYNAEALQLKGDIFYKQGNLNLAESLLNQSFTLDENNLRTRLLLAEVYIALSDIEQALKHISFVLDLKPNYPNVNLLYAFALFKSDKKNEAAKVAKNISAYLSKLDDADLNRYPSLRLIQGTSLYMQESWENAYSHLNYYALRFPGHEQSHLMVANMDMKFERYQSAMEILEHYNGEERSLEYWLLKLNALVKLGKMFEALVVVDQAMEGFPHELTLLEYKSKLLVATNNLREALMLMESIFEQGSASDQLALLLGQLQLSLTEINKASATVARLLKEKPDNPVYLSLSAGIDLQSGKFVSAQQKLEHALDLAPKMLQLYVNLYYVYIAQKNVNQAAEILNKAYQLSPNQPLLLTKLAELSEQVRNFQASIQWRKQLYKLQPDNLDNLVRYAEALVRTGDSKSALQLLLLHRIDYRLNAQYLARLATVYLDLKRCSDVDQVLGVLYGLSLNHARRLVTIANMYMQCHRFELANRALTYAEQLDINNIYVQLARARWFLDINQAELALRLLKPLAQSGHQKALQLEISAYEYLGDEESAISIAQRLFKLYPRPLYVYKLYRLLETAKRADEGIVILEEYLRQTDNINIRRTLAHAYLQMKNKQSAEKHFIILAKSHNDALAYRQLAILKSEENIEQAVTYAKKAYGIDQQSPAIAATYGWLLTQSGKPTEGLPLLRSAHARNANQPTLLYRMAETLLLLDRQEQALKYFKQAARFDFPDRQRVDLRLNELANR
ncbi:XrtA/PEP-CTERM system TPR-repeat protein PrsT [Thalassotalea sp. G2M2-11]|uniref:XrtA/PEP-CTERM system TPR-repeat protein PrsT n=1 Tax=Thalassotalea sp. G2M2-11 TaxID=2787627 RepID=UPI0019D28AB5|nr:XrtA/PEP-CTERM system TPR-repeat protein PrsT [Thalassotalea sp. G2M2-11]